MKKSHKAIEYKGKYTQPSQPDSVTSTQNIGKRTGQPQEPVNTKDLLWREGAYPSQANENIYIYYSSDSDSNSDNDKSRSGFSDISVSDDDDNEVETIMEVSNENSNTVSNITKRSHLKNTAKSKMQKTANSKVTNKSVDKTAKSKAIKPDNNIQESPDLKQRTVKSKTNYADKENLDNLARLGRELEFKESAAKEYSKNSEFSAISKSIESASISISKSNTKIEKKKVEMDDLELSFNHDMDFRNDGFKANQANRYTNRKPNVVGLSTIKKSKDESVMEMDESRKIIDRLSQNDNRGNTNTNNKYDKEFKSSVFKKQKSPQKSFNNSLNNISNNIDSIEDSKTNRSASKNKANKKDKENINNKKETQAKNNKDNNKNNKIEPENQNNINTDNIKTQKSRGSTTNLNNISNNSQKNKQTDIEMLLQNEDVYMHDYNDHENHDHNIEKKSRNFSELENNSEDEATKAIKAKRNNASKPLSDAQLMKKLYNEQSYLKTYELDLQHSDRETFGVNGRYSKRLRIPRLNHLSGEGLIYGNPDRSSYGVGDGVRMVGIIGVRSNKAKVSQISCKYAELGKPIPQRRLVKRADRIENIIPEDPSDSDYSASEVSDKDQAKRIELIDRFYNEPSPDDKSVHICTVGPNSQKKLSKNMSNLIKIQILQAGKGAEIIIGDKTYNQIKEKQKYEIKPHEKYSFKNYSDKALKISMRIV